MFSNLLIVLVSFSFKSFAFINAISFSIERDSYFIDFDLSKKYIYKKLENERNKNNISLTHILIVNLICFDKHVENTLLFTLISVKSIQQ